MGREIHWRCFHCGDTFTRAQERWARQHFGADEDALPACQMRLPGEHHLLNLLREAQDELRRHRAEDTELWRALYAQAADHAAALRREEERGYEKGLADGRALAQPSPLTVPETPRHADAPCTDCGGTGITYQTERRCACTPPAESGARVCQGSEADTAQGTLPPEDQSLPSTPVNADKTEGATSDGSDA